VKTIKVSEATKIQLDWLVAKIQGIDLFETEGWHYTDGGRKPYQPSTDWSQGGPIIERERIAVQSPNDKGWYATDYMLKTYESGPTPLIAAMRCYVTSKLGETVEIPKGLL